MFKKILSLFGVVLISLALGSCDELGMEENDNNDIVVDEPGTDVDEPIIKLNGDLLIEVEVFDEFLEPGIKHPDDYSVITKGYINTDVVDMYELQYLVFTNDGELVKELYRFVSVVDKIKPIIKEREVKDLYAGFTYTIDDFIESYEDNYDDINDLIVMPNESIVFKNGGTKEVLFSIKDLSDNEAVYRKSFNVILDFERLIDEVYKFDPHNPRKSTMSSGTKYINVDIDEKRSFSYFDSGSLHYLKSFDSKLGTRASIQISSNYGEFNNASLNYHISGLGNDYSVGFIEFDATKDYENLSFASFISTINNLNLNEQDMLNEMNLRVLEVLEEFKEYVTNVLRIEFK